MPFASGAKSALSKIEASLPHERARKVQDLMMRIMIGNPSPPSVRHQRTVSPLLARLFELAFSEERLLAFEYHDRTGTASRRIVEPHGLLVRAPLWYVIAWDTAIDKPRLFRSDRIRSPHVLANTFIPRPHELVRGVCPDARPVQAASH
ncbi:MAG: WYL domain-containing protein [Actinomycetia bacterium]|nr:WYL domain-containing protein [Actinomycetes bacterium]